VLRLGRDRNFVEEKESWVAGRVEVDEEREGDGTLRKIGVSLGGSDIKCNDVTSNERSPSEEPSVS
jgi:hypothetical protein